MIPPIGGVAIAGGNVLIWGCGWRMGPGTGRGRTDGRTDGTDGQTGKVRQSQLTKVAAGRLKSQDSRFLYCHTFWYNVENVPGLTNFA